jgi:hypothetical protein
MPVELPVCISQATPPAPPRATVWLTLFVVGTLCNVVGTLLTWNDASPTSSIMFWVRLLVLPTLAWSFVFGLRLHYFQEESIRLAAEEDALAEDRKTALQFASDPLAVLGYTYLCSLGDKDVATTVAAGKTDLKASTPLSGGKAIRHTVLSFTEGTDEPERYRACFTALLKGIADKVKTLPSAAPLIVYLHLPLDADSAVLMDTWKACWLRLALRPVQMLSLSAETGLMVLDGWLDMKGGPALEKFALFVSIQLHDTPPQNSAEAAVAVLLGWPPLAERYEIAPLASLHRPVEATPTTISELVLTALLWGRTAASQIDHLWQAGLEKPDKPALVKCASDLTMGGSSEKRTDVHDVDVAIGHPGLTAGWLAVALAIEHSIQIGKPQLIAWREETLRFAVVQPIEQMAGVKSNEDKMGSTV